MANDDASAMEAFLHRRMPLTAAMEVRVSRLDLEGVELSAPLVPNRNHFGAAYGGSIATLAMTAAWLLIHWHVMDRTPAPTVVIAEQRVVFEQPITGPFRALATAPERADWLEFERALERWGRGRIELPATVEAEGITAARFEGSFVAIGG